MGDFNFGEAKETYLSSGGTICPVCGDSTIEGGSIDVEGGVAMQYMNCNSCSAAWTDIFRRVDIIITSDRINGGTAQSVCQKCGSPLSGEYCSDDVCPYSEWPQRVQINELQEEAAEGLRERYSVLPRIRIAAEVHDDALFKRVDFDAAPWFTQATDADILALQQAGWSGDNMADEVAYYFDGHNKEIVDLFALCRATQSTSNPQGFECSVDKDSAKVWLKQHRKGLWARLLCDENAVRLVEAQEEEIRGRWDWLDDNGNASETSFETIGDAALNAVETLSLDIPGEGGV